MDIKSIFEGAKLKRDITPDCTHLVLLVPKVTVKVIVALAMCLNIVTEEWVQQLADGPDAPFLMPSTEKFAPKLPQTDHENLSSISFKPNPDRKKILKGINFIVYSEDQKSSICGVVEPAGGKVIIFDPIQDPGMIVLNELLDKSSTSETYALFPPEKNAVYRDDIDRVLNKRPGMRYLTENDIAYAILQVSAEHCNPFIPTQFFSGNSSSNRNLDDVSQGLSQFNMDQNESNHSLQSVISFQIQNTQCRNEDCGFQNTSRSTNVATSFLDSLIDSTDFEPVTPPSKRVLKKLLSPKPSLEPISLAQKLGVMVSDVKPSSKEKYPTPIKRDECIDDEKESQSLRTKRKLNVVENDFAEPKMKKIQNTISVISFLECNTTENELHKTATGDSKPKNEEIFSEEIGPGDVSSLSADPSLDFEKNDKINLFELQTPTEKSPINPVNENFPLLSLLHDKNSTVDSISDKGKTSLSKLWSKETIEITHPVNKSTSQFSILPGVETPMMKRQRRNGKRLGKDDFDNEEIEEKSDIHWIEKHESKGLDNYCLEFFNFTLPEKSASVEVVSETNLVNFKKFKKATYAGQKKSKIIRVVPYSAESIQREESWVVKMPKLPAKIKDQERVDKPNQRIEKEILSGKNNFFVDVDELIYEDGINATDVKREFEDGFENIISGHHKNRWRIGLDFEGENEIFSGTFEKKNQKSKNFDSGDDNEKVELNDFGRGSGNFVEETKMSSKFGKVLLNVEIAGEVGQEEKQESKKSSVKKSSFGAFRDKLAKK
ncbi:hypothetical protein HK096_002996 [Nowakowskiella sp. JEL0078]|nr:hypothetical protein HK096_002996 [Nowakowskiella sp. JEL0078]